MQQVHCPRCSRAMNVDLSMPQVTCPACNASFNPMYPFGQPLNQPAPPQNPPAYFPQNPQYPQSPQYPPPMRYPVPKKGMATWKIVLIILVAVGLYGGLIGINVFVDDTDDSDGGQGVASHDVVEIRKPSYPLTIRADSGGKVFVGERAKISLWVNGGTGPYHFDINGVGDGWTTEVNDAAIGYANTNCIVSGVAHEPGIIPFGVTVTDANGDTAWLDINITVVNLPDDVGTLKLTTGLAANSPPWVNGDAFETYPGQTFHFSAYAECQRTGLAFESTALTCNAPDLPESVKISQKTRTLDFAGRLDVLGEWEFRIDADIHLRDFPEVLQRTRTFKLRVVAPPKSVWPTSSGTLRVLNPVMFVNTPCRAGVTLTTPTCPFAASDWPGHVDWTCTGDLPPGLSIETSELAWAVAGKPTTPGEYTVEVKGTLHLDWIDTTYEITQSLTIRVK